MNKSVRYIITTALVQKVNIIYFQTISRLEKKTNAK